MRFDLMRIDYKHEPPGIVMGDAVVRISDIMPEERDWSFFELQSLLDYALGNVPMKAILPCQYCGQWGARECACAYCGGTVTD